MDLSSGSVAVYVRPVSIDEHVNLKSPSSCDNSDA